MIKLIGLKRIIVIAILLGINLLALGAYMGTLAPMLEDARTQLRTVDGQIADLRNNIAIAKQEVAFVNENLTRYQELRDKGLFMEQDRFMIDRLLQEMRGKAGVDNFSFTIGELTAVPNSDAESIGHRLVSSRIDVDKIVSLFDSNIYTFLQDIGKSFPAHTRLEKFSVRRTGDVNEKALGDINDGKQVSFVSANIVFNWLTLADESAGPADKAGGR